MSQDCDSKSERDAQMRIMELESTLKTPATEVNNNGTLNGRKLNKRAKSEVHLFNSANSMCQGWQGEPMVKACKNS